MYVYAYNYHDLCVRIPIHPDLHARFVVQLTVITTCSKPCVYTVYTYGMRVYAHIYAMQSYTLCHATRSEVSYIQSHTHTVYVYACVCTHVCMLHAVACYSQGGELPQLAHRIYRIFLYLPYTYILIFMHAVACYSQGGELPQLAHRVRHLGELVATHKPAAAGGCDL